MHMVDSPKQRITETSPKHMYFKNFKNLYKTRVGRSGET